MRDLVKIEKGVYINAGKARFRVKLCRRLYRLGLYGLARKVDNTCYLLMSGVDMSEISRAAQAKKTAGQEPQTGKWSNVRQGGEAEHDR